MFDKDALNLFLQNTGTKLCFEQDVLQQNNKLVGALWWINYDISSKILKKYLWHYCFPLSYYLLANIDANTDIRDTLISVMILQPLINY